MKQQQIMGKLWKWFKKGFVYGMISTILSMLGLAGLEAIVGLQNLGVAVISVLIILLVGIIARGYVIEKINEIKQLN